MSERGSFVTEYMYCDACFEAAKAVLCQDDKFLKGVPVPMWGGHAGELPIIAGKIGGSYGGEEIFAFEHELIPELEAVICHPVRIAVLPEDGDGRIFVAHPRRGEG